MGSLVSPYLLALVLAAQSVDAGVRPAVASGDLLVEEAQVSVQVDPKAGTILGKVLLTLRNRTERELAAVDLMIPDPYGATAKVEVVWDRNEELPWRRAVADESKGEFRIQAPLSRPLGQGKKLIVGLSFELRLQDADRNGTWVGPGRFELRGTGWYPVAADGPSLPGKVRLSVRLPKDWVVDSPLKVRRRHKGIALSEFEVSYEGQAAGRVVFAARASGSE